MSESSLHFSELYNDFANRFDMICRVPGNDLQNRFTAKCKLINEGCPISNIQYWNLEFGFYLRFGYWNLDFHCLWSLVYVFLHITRIIARTNSIFSAIRL